jgi:hypothetical protein
MWYAISWGDASCLRPALARSLICMFSINLTHKALKRKRNAHKFNHFSSDVCCPMGVQTRCRKYFCDVHLCWIELCIRAFLWSLLITADSTYLRLGSFIFDMLVLSTITQVSTILNREMLLNGWTHFFRMARTMLTRSGIASKFLGSSHLLYELFDP